jgi:hypothetical protein
MASSWKELLAKIECRGGSSLMPKIAYKIARTETR